MFTLIFPMMEEMQIVRIQTYLDLHYVHWFNLKKIKSLLA